MLEQLPIQIRIGAIILIVLGIIVVVDFCINVIKKLVAKIKHLIEHHDPCNVD